MSDLIKRLRLQSEHIPVRTLFDDAADRIEQTEAKMAKAIEALKEIEADCVSHGAIKYTIRAVLAELEGK